MNRCLMQARVVRIGVVVCLATLACAGRGCAQAGGDDKFEVRGRVVNSATGAGVGNALVRLGGCASESQFSAPDGSFVLTGVPRGNCVLDATKPGFFNAQELGRQLGRGALRIVPLDTDATIELTPEAVIYGKVESESGQPVEDLRVRAESWTVVDGQKRLDTVGQGDTDDEGKFRIAELKPGTYYVNFLAEGRGGWRVFSGIGRKNREEQGYGSQFYPGVADITSASPIRLRGGSQMQITETLKRQKLYEIAGVIRGSNLEKGFAVNLLQPSGEPIQKNVHMDGKTGEFQIEGVPEGKYLLMAMIPDENSKEGMPLTAMIPVQLNRDVSGLTLFPARGGNLAVNVNDEIAPDTSVVVQGASVGAGHPVNITLTSKDWPQMSQGLWIPPGRDDTTSPRQFQGLVPGTYEVQAQAPAGYVASLRCGDVNLLSDDLVVAAGTAMPPIEVTLRSDSAQIEAEVTENGKPVAGRVLLYSEEYPKSSLDYWEDEGNAVFSNLRPGAYRVVAVKGLQDVEFRDAVSVQKYLSSGKEVNLRAGDKAKVRVEVLAREEE